MRRDAKKKQDKTEFTQTCILAIWFIKCTVILYCVYYFIVFMIPKFFKHLTD